MAASAAQLARAAGPAEAAEAAAAESGGFFGEQRWSGRQRGGRLGRLGGDWSCVGGIWGLQQCFNSVSHFKPVFGTLPSLVRMRMIRLFSPKCSIAFVVAWHLFRPQDFLVNWLSQMGLRLFLQHAWGTLHNWVPLVSFLV